MDRQADSDRDKKQFKVGTENQKLGKSADPQEFLRHTRVKITHPLRSSLIFLAVGCPDALPRLDSV